MGIKIRRILKIENLSKNFGGFSAVKDFKMNLQEGKITALLGPNGAGKTTVFNLISGLIKEDSGKINFCGIDITNRLPEERANLGIGRLFQNLRIFYKLTVFENILLGFKIPEFEKPFSNILNFKKYSKIHKNIYDKAEELISLVRLEKYRDTYAENLSYGQQKLVSIARLMAFDCKLLLLDEPTAGIAQGVELEILELLKRLAYKYNLTIFLIEHKMSVVLNFADWVIFMDEGSLRLQGTPEHVLGNEEVRKIYVGL